VARPTSDVGAERAAKKGKTAKRSQFPGVLYDVDWVAGQGVSGYSGTFWHLASFCRHGFVLGSDLQGEKRRVGARGLQRQAETRYASKAREGANQS
jgi:hypothetical protein